MLQFANNLLIIFRETLLVFIDQDFSRLGFEPELVVPLEEGNEAIMTNYNK